MSLVMVSSPVDHSYANSLSSPPIKIHDFALEYANECAAAQTLATEKLNSSQTIMGNHNCFDHAKESSKELLNDRPDENLNKDANGIAKPPVDTHLHSHPVIHASGHPMGPAHGLTNGHGNGYANGHANPAMNGNSKDPPSRTQAEYPTSVSKDKYRHIMAVHSRTRTSCLSHDSTASPTFLGFRNLMVLVLSTCSPGISSILNGGGSSLIAHTVVMNLRLVIENFVKVS